MDTCYLCGKERSTHPVHPGKQRAAYIRIPGKGFVRIGTYRPRCHFVLLHSQTKFPTI